MDVEEALEIAEEAFPKGPETLAGRLGAEVFYSPLQTRAGWCVTYKERIRIRINSLSKPTRQRFTLAHELAHVILGTEPDLMALSARPFSSNLKEEREADELAAKLLLPAAEVSAQLTSKLVDYQIIKRLAKRAAISEVAVACNLANRSKVLGIENAAVISFKGEEVSWIWSNSLKLSATNESLLELLRETQGSATVVRKRQKQNTMTAFSFGGEEFPGVFVQLLPHDVAATETTGEEIAALRVYIFQGEMKAEQRLSGYLGAYKPKIANLSEKDAVDAFLKHYSKQLDDLGRELKRRLSDSKGRRFLGFRLTRR